MRYAVVVSGNVVNVVTAETPEFASSQGWVSIPEGLPVDMTGWVYENETLFPASQVEPGP